MPTDILPAEPMNEVAALLPPLVLEVEPRPQASPGKILWESFVNLFVVAAAVVLGTILALVIGLFSGWIPLC